MHLIGGGRDLELAETVYGPFVAQTRVRAARAGRANPRIAVEPATAAEDQEDPLRLIDGSTPDATFFEDLDGLLVGGGLPPAYHRVLQPHAGAIRAAVRGGVPYAGFSAGAMIAPQRALLGGWRLGSTAVTHEDNAEDLDQVTVVDGLGLISSTVEVHTSQWGTLSRLVAAVAAGLATSGIAVDENTVVILDPATDGPVRAGGASGTVIGTGQAWFLTADDGSVRVERREPGRTP